MNAISRFALVGMICLIVGAAGNGLWADHDHGRGRGNDRNDPTAVGAWFGIARPCPADPGDGGAHVAFCQQICGSCLGIPGVLPPEVPMMPTLLADGTVIADDAGELGLFHTPAHGKWEVSEKDGLPNRRGTTRLRATFFWLGQFGPPPTNQLDNAVRPRFVTYFDPSDPDRMLGFIQPYFFPFAAGGQVVVNPFNPLDALAGNHIPAMDPLAPLPAGCQLDKGCLGTYHFVIRRIKAQ